MDAIALPAHRRFRLPVRLRGRRPGRSQRQRRVAVPAPLRLAQRVRRAARPGGGGVPAGPLGRHPADRPPLPAGHAGARDQLADRRWLVGRDRRPAHGPLAPRRGVVPHPPPGPHRLRRRPRAAAHRPLPDRRGAGGAGLRTGLRLRPPTGAVGLHRPRLPRGRGQRRGRGPPAPAHHRPAPRLRGAPGPRPHPAQGGRHPILRPVVERARAASHLRGGRGPPAVDRAPLAPLARSGSLPRPPLAAVPPAQRPDAQGPDLRPHRGADRRSHHLAARDAGR